MLQRYPVDLTLAEDGTIVAQAVDLPEALTFGDTEAEALATVRDALHVALTGYLEDRRDIPAPSRPKRGQQSIALDPTTALKLGIYRGMREHGMTQAALAEQLAIDARQVRRILDLDHNTRLDHLEAALAAVGKRLVIDLVDRVA